MYLCFTYLKKWRNHLSSHSCNVTSRLWKLFVVFTAPVSKKHKMVGNLWMGYMSGCTHSSFSFLLSPARNSLENTERCQWFEAGNALYPSYNLCPWVLTNFSMAQDLPFSNQIIIFRRQRPTFRKGRYLQMNHVFRGFFVDTEDHLPWSNPQTLDISMNGTRKLDIQNSQEPSFTQNMSGYSCSKGNMFRILKFPRLS